MKLLALALSRFCSTYLFLIPRNSLPEKNDSICVSRQKNQLGFRFYFAYNNSITKIRGTHSKDVADNKCHNNKRYQDTGWYKSDGRIIAEICMTAPAVTESIMDRVIAAVWYCYKETTCKNDIIIRELCKSWDNEKFMVMHLEKIEWFAKTFSNLNKVLSRPFAIGRKPIYINISAISQSVCQNQNLPTGPRILGALATWNSSK